jgi:superfamily I DNA/RNA helicase
VRTFHGWCYDMLSAYHLPRPGGAGNAFFDALVEAVIRGVDGNAIPRAQYGAVLIDEGHDFRPEWFKLVVQMIDPDTNSLLVLYDDAQSIYGGRRGFSFASVGIEARGRTTILRLNYRNTLEILATARSFAAGLLDARDTDEDEAPNLAPESAGRRGPLPELIHCASRRDEAQMILAHIRDALDRGRSPNDIAIVYRQWETGSLLAQTLRAAGIPLRWATKGSGKDELFEGDPGVKLVTLHSSKGLEFPLVFIPGICTHPHGEAETADESKLLYVGMTRALEVLVLSYTTTTPLVTRMSAALAAAQRMLAAA